MERERERKRGRKKNGEERKSEREKEGEFIVANGVGCDKTAELDRLLLQSTSLLTISYKGFYGRILFYSRKKTTFRKRGEKKMEEYKKKKKGRIYPARGQLENSNDTMRVYCCFYNENEVAYVPTISLCTGYEA